jgi:lysophospholipase L1-like esterase
MSELSSDRAMASPVSMSWKRGFALLGGSVLLTLLLLEGIARLVFSAPAAWGQPQLRFESDAELIFKLVPRQVGYTADVMTRINEHGLRGAAVPLARVDGVARILFLGDSIVFGYGVGDRDTVTEQLASALAGEGVRTEVINAGVPAYNSEQEIAYLLDQGLGYDPDWVVLGFCWNDIAEKVGVEIGASGELRSPGEIDDGSVVDGPAGYAVRNVIKRSRLLYNAVRGWRALRARAAPPDRATAMRQSVLDGRDTAPVQAGWARVRAALQRLRQAADERGFRPLVVAFPLPIALEREFPHRTYPARLQEIAAEVGLPFHDLEPAFRAAFRGHDSLFIPYDGDHPNPAGTQVAARAIAAAIEGSPSPAAQDPRGMARRNS